MSRIVRLICLLAVSFVHYQSLKADNIGLLIMATGKYVNYVGPLVTSAQRHFCKNHKVTFFVFTDSKLVGTHNVRVIYQPRLGWPFDSMMRFKVYYDNREEFAGQDYLYACDADMLFIGEVGDEILSDRVATTHPGFYSTPRNSFSYEDNPLSLACVNYNEGEIYFAGGFYGGKTGEVLNLLKTTSENIEADLSRGIIAVWHDESHLNRFFIDSKPTLVLSPSYCYPEGWDLPFYPKLMALNKNHMEMRKDAD